MRGVLTERVQKIAKAKLGREISQVELRLLPYIQYTMANSQKIEGCKINDEERKVLRLWRDAGFIEGGVGGLSITKGFWDFMCEIIFTNYVDVSEDYGSQTKPVVVMEVRKNE